MKTQTRIFHLLGIILLLSAFMATTNQHARAGGAITVNAVNEGDDATPGDGFCATVGSVCTLRAALEEANALGGSSPLNILFGLPGSGVHVISITSGPLPAVTAPINLDGTSQPGCTAPCIVLSGASLAGTGINGLALNANGSTIKGFIFTSWSGHGISIASDQNTIQTNDIGFWPGNPTLLPNGDGIAIDGSNNLIGGPSAAQRNVISGNTWQGITVANGCCAVISSNMIQNNYIGTNAAGTAALGNHYRGISLFSHADLTTVTGNLISGNLGWGIDLYGATHSTIRGNRIGTNALGTGALGNALGGVYVEQGASTNTIGGPSAGQPNNISYNHGVGIRVLGTATINNRFQRNSIFGNSALGIDLGPAGATSNDPHDLDTGPNRLQNFPLLTAATGATHAIAGNLNSVPARSFVIEFFASPAGTCDPSGHGEGKKFLGAQLVTTNAAGSASFTYVTPGAFNAGQVITATATDSAGDTSEFSTCRVAG